MSEGMDKEKRFAVVKVGGDNCIANKCNFCNEKREPEYLCKLSDYIEPCVEECTKGKTVEEWREEIAEAIWEKEKEIIHRVPWEILKNMHRKIVLKQSIIK